MRKLMLAITLSVIAASLVAGCESESERSEVDTQQGNCAKLVDMEPALEVTNPKNRENVKFFTETWNEEGQLAYVYLQNNEGNMIGYYALDDPPVSMCTSLTPPDRQEYSDSPTRVAPGIDGVYRSSEDCSRYYGKDASTGTYVEFTVGTGINMLLYTEPLDNHPNVETLAPSN